MSLSPRPKYTPALRGRRVLITGAARGLGAGIADLLTAHGARVALAGLEPELLAEVAARNHAPWRECDVADPDAVDGAVQELVAELGGLDIVIANAGIAKQLPIIGGQPGVMEAHLRVNTLGAFYTLRSAGPHISHPSGYALATASSAVPCTSRCWVPTARARLRWKRSATPCARRSSRAGRRSASRTTPSWRPT